MDNNPSQKYLRTRAITDPWQLNGTVRNDFQVAIVIPVLAERQSLPQTLLSLTTNPAADLDRTLVVVVVNNRDSASVEQLRDNQQVLAWLRSEPFSQLNLAWVDAGSPGLQIPAKDGVGLARKIGFDQALELLDWTGTPLLASLDADTLVDENYLPAIFSHFRHSRNGGATLPFRHQVTGNVQQEQAIRRYELYLRSYLFGLQHSGSPYAFHTIGSAFACRAEAYVKVGGMNRRLAGEDFYFLQQLAKTAGIEMLSGTVVQPSPRFSARVPFGTGRVVQGQVEQGERLFGFTSAGAFSVLHDWLQLVAANWQAPAAAMLVKAGEISPLLGEFLTGLRFLRSWERLQQNHPGRQQFLAAFHGWFDSLRTRQLLSRLETGGAGADRDLVAGLLFWGGQAEMADEIQQLRLLETLQGVG